MLDKMLIIKFFLQGVPEVAAVLFVSFAMVGYQSKTKELLFLAVSFTLIVYTLRTILGPTGVYSIAGLILLVLVLHKVTKISVIPAFLITVIVNFLLVVLEFIMLKAVNILLNYQLTYQPTNGGDWLWIISGWPQVIILFIFGHFVYKYFKPGCCFAGFRR